MSISDCDYMSDEADCDSESGNDGYDTDLEHLHRSVQKPPYDILTIDQARTHMCNFTEAVESTTQVPVWIVKLLLYHFKWDKDKLMDRFYAGDLVKLYDDVGIITEDETKPKVIYRFTPNSHDSFLFHFRLAAAKGIRKR